MLDEGRIVEFDEPNELLKKTTGSFRKLVDETGNIEAARLELLAREAKELRDMIAEQNNASFPGSTITNSRTRAEILEIFGGQIVYETSL